MIKFKINILNFLCALSFVLWISCSEAADNFVYDSHGRRDPFIPLIGANVRGASSREILSIEDVNFQGIARDAKGKRIIIVNGEMLRVGDSLDALSVIRITEDEAIVKIRDKEYNLNLYEKEE